MIANQDTIDRGFELFRAIVEEDAPLRDEFEQSSEEFFRQGLPATDVLGRALAERRHLEWFLFERASPRLPALAMEIVLERCAESGNAFEPEHEQAFLRSHASVFEVTGVRPGEGLWLRDLASLGEYPLIEPEASAALKNGDMIAGRLFPVGDALYHASRACTFFRNPQLLAALRTDLQRARENRRGTLRLSQLELEAMLFGPHALPAGVDPVGEARELLAAEGLDRQEVDALLAELESEPYSAQDLLNGAHDALGAILDRLAFETSIDLEVARRILTHAWAELTRRRASTKDSPVADVGADSDQPANVAHLVAEFDRKRKSGLPIEEIFEELERELALDDPDMPEDESPAPDFPGVIDAVVQEFLWQISIERGAVATHEYECLRSLGRFGERIGVLENLRARDLLTYTCFWLPESGELENADEARKLMHALHEFCRWIEAEHQLPLLSDFQATLKTLNSSLPRIIEANRRRTRPTESAHGELFEVLSVDHVGVVLVRDRLGAEDVPEFDPWLTEWLRPGDRIRGRITDGRFALYCCYPPESAALAQSDDVE